MHNNELTAQQEICSVYETHTENFRFSTLKRFTWLVVFSIILYECCFCFTVRVWVIQLLKPCDLKKLGTLVLCVCVLDFINADFILQRMMFLGFLFTINKIYYRIPFELLPFQRVLPGPHTAEWKEGWVWDKKKTLPITILTENVASIPIGVLVCLFLVETEQLILKY
jgi:hypothetical protein